MKFERIFGYISIFSEIFQFRSAAWNHPIQEALFCFKIGNICVKIHYLGRNGLHPICAARAACATSPSRINQNTKTGIHEI